MPYSVVVSLSIRTCQGEKRRCTVFSAKIVAYTKSVVVYGTSCKVCVGLIGFSFCFLFFCYLGVLPEPAKSQEHLKSFAKMLSEKNLLNLMKVCLGSGQDCSKVTEAVVCFMFNYSTLVPIWL